MLRLVSMSIVIFCAVANCAAQEMVAPDVISTGNFYAGCFTPSGDTMYFFRKVEPVGEEYQLYLSVKNDAGEFDNPQRLTEFGDYSNLYPALSKDGKRMVYTSYRPAPGKFGEHKQAYLWYSDKDEKGNWKAPVFIENINLPDYYHSNPVLSPEGDIVFRRLTSDYRNRTTWIAYRDGNGYKDPILYEPAEQWKAKIDSLIIVGGQPTADPDVVILSVRVFRKTDDRPEPAKKWITRRVDGEWTDPQPIPELLQEGTTDNFLFFSPDGKWLYLTRNLGYLYKYEVKGLW